MPSFVFGSHKSFKKSLYPCKEVIKLSEFQELLIDLILIGSYLKAFGALYSLGLGFVYS